jgi:hypothetical protein
MIIARDGKEIKLTDEEVWQAFCERKEECLKSDIVAYFERKYDIEISPEEAVMFLEVMDRARDDFLDSSVSELDRCFSYSLDDYECDDEVCALLKKHGYR